MKLTLNLKDPDGVSNSISEAAESTRGSDLSDDEWEAIEGLRREKLEEALEPWVTDGEYVTVEIDTVAQTAVVVKTS